MSHDFPLPSWKVASAVVIAAALMIPRRSEIPSHMFGVPMVATEDFLSDRQVDALLHLTQTTMGTINSTIRDDYKELDSIGEATAYSTELYPKTGCPLYMLADKSKRMCAFAGRADAGRHFFKYGGRTRGKVKYQTHSPRPTTFLGRFLFSSPRPPDT